MKVTVTDLAEFYDTAVDFELGIEGTGRPLTEVEFQDWVICALECSGPHGSGLLEPPVTFDLEGLLEATDMLGIRIAGDEMTDRDLLDVLASAGATVGGFDATVEDQARTIERAAQPERREEGA
jgi:hypothetical protein